MAKRTKRIKRSRPSVDLGKARKKLKEQEELAKRRKSGGRTGFWKPSEGKNVIRIFPPWTEEGENANQFWREVWLHFGIPPGAEEAKTLLCVRRMQGKKCYVCEQVNKLYNSADPMDIALAKDVKAKQQFISNIIDMNEPTHEVDGEEVPFIQPYRYGPMIYDELLSYVCDNEYGDITDIDEGFNIIIERTGTGVETRYKVRAMRNPSSWEDEEIDEAEALKAMADLDDLPAIHSHYVPLPYSVQQLAYEGYEEDADEEDPKQLAADDDFDDEDLDDEDEDLDDEDEDLDDEDEDLDDDEVDELERDLKRAAGRRRSARRR